MGKKKAIKAKKRAEEATAAPVVVAEPRFKSYPDMIRYYLRPPERTYRDALRGFAVFMVLSVAIYWTSVHSPFFSDDAYLTQSAEHCRHPMDFMAILKTPYWGDVGEHALYRPVVVWTLAFNYLTNTLNGLDGASPFIYRFTNIILHALASLLVVRLCQQLGMTSKVSYLGGILFAVHPYHAEALSFMVNRSEMISLIFMCLYVIAHLQGKVWRALFYLLFALCSKESAISSIGAVFVLDIFMQNRKIKLLTWAAYIALTVAWWEVRSYLVKGLITLPYFAANPLEGMTLMERIPNALAIQLEYVRDLIWPSRIVTNFHMRELTLIESWADSRIVMLAILMTAIMAVALYMYWKFNERLPLIAAIVYGGFMFPISSIPSTVGPLMAERLMYTPSVIICVVFAAILCKLAQNTPRAEYLSAVLILAWGGYAARRNWGWRTPFAQGEQSVVSSPMSVNSYCNYAKALLEERRYKEAIAVMEQSLDIMPEDPFVLFNLGYMHMESGENLDIAVKAFQGAIYSNPLAASHWYLMATTLVRMKDDTGAFTIGKGLVSLFPLQADRDLKWKVNAPLDPMHQTLRQAMLAYDNRKFEEAVTLLEATIRHKNFSQLSPGLRLGAMKAFYNVARTTKLEVPADIVALREQTQKEVNNLLNEVIKSLMETRMSGKRSPTGGMAG